MVRIHQHSQPHAGRHLLTGGVVVRDILRDLTGHQLHLPHIRLLHSNVGDRREDPFSQCPGNIQLAFFIRRQDHCRLIRISLYVAFAVRGHKDPARGTAAVDLQCQKVLFILHHSAHHHAGSHQASQGRRHHRGRVMDLPRLLRQVPGSHGKSADITARREGADHVIFHIFSPLPPESSPPAVFLFLPA